MNIPPEHSRTPPPPPLCVTYYSVHALSFIQHATISSIQFSRVHIVHYSRVSHFDRVIERAAVSIPRLIRDAVCKRKSAIYTRGVVRFASSDNLSERARAHIFRL